MTSSWLPALICLESFGGNVDAYLDHLYGHFSRDFIASLPAFPGKRVSLKRYPVYRGKVGTFWHFISEGENEDDREIDFRRCERIRWPRPIIDVFPNPEQPAPTTSPIVWWRSERSREWRYVIALRDFSYVVVLADRGDYVLPWTAYTVERETRRQKLRAEHDRYWAA